MNFVMLLFSLLTTSIILMGSLLNMFENRLPTYFIKLIRYGKFAHNGKISGFTKRMIKEVPKSWFCHFYCLGVLAYSVIFYQVTTVYVFNSDVSGWLAKLLDISCGNKRVAYIPAIKAYTALVLMCLQVFRRFYDTHFVTIFGKNAKINIVQYFVGLVHYPGSVLAIICEAPKFANMTLNNSSTLKLTEFSHFDILAIALFLWAWWHQHVTTQILANLRKDKNGNIISDAHKLPQGDWFKYLSCPHQTAEILMYFSVTILLCYNITWFFVFIWVLSNQVVTITLSHWWYQKTFDKFPPTRKALIPFIY